MAEGNPKGPWVRILSLNLCLTFYRFHYTSYPGPAIFPGYSCRENWRCCTCKHGNSLLSLNAFKGIKHGSETSQSFCTPLRATEKLIFSLDPVWRQQGDEIGKKEIRGQSSVVRTSEGVQAAEKRNNTPHSSHAHNSEHAPYHGGRQPKSVRIFTGKRKVVRVFN
jgi:hypothetical protein